VKVLLISDSTGLGLMEERPEPAWRVRLSSLRNKDLLAPDYGAMYVAAYLESRGHDIRVVNLIADVHHDVELFREPNTGPDEFSGAMIGGPDAPKASRDYLFDTLGSYQPDVIFLTLSIYNLALFSRKLLADIKKAYPDGMLVTGGIYSTLHPDEILGDGNADVVIRGEGEVTAAELLQAVTARAGLDGVMGISYRKSGQVIHNPARGPVPDLDVLPHPYTVSEKFNIGRRFELLSSLNPADDYIPGAGFLTSRGCPEACTFCLDPAINRRRTRFHSPAYTRNVLDYCAEHFPGGAGSFFFGDATFTMNRKRLRSLLGLLDGLPYSYQIQTRADYLDDRTVELLAESGFTTVAIGAETFNEKILQEVAKKRLKVNEILDAARSVRGHGMHPVLTFIVGFPGETRESIERTVEILKQNQLYTATFFPLVVFRGTELFELFRKRFSSDEMEGMRLNPMSEEFLFLSDEFPTLEEITGFTRKVNRSLMDARTAAT